MLLLSGTIAAGTRDLVGPYANISGYREVTMEVYSPVATNGTAYLYSTNVSQGDNDPPGDPNIPWDASGRSISSIQPNQTQYIYPGATYGVQNEWVRGFFSLSAPIGQNAPVYIVLTARS